MAKIRRTEEERTFDRELGARIRAARIACGARMSELAQEVGVSHRVLYRCERGQIRFSAPVFIRIARVLDVSMRSLVPDCHKKTMTTESACNRVNP